MTLTISASVFAWLCATMGLLALGVPMLFVQQVPKQPQSPLAVFLLASGIANGLPVWIEFFPSVELYGLAIVLPLYFLQPACLWLYVDYLISSVPWRWSPRHRKHLFAPLVALALALVLAALPREQLRLVFLANDAPVAPYTHRVIVCAFALMVAWVFIAGAYVTAIVVRLTRYRRQLRQLFANNEQRELYWLNGVITMLSLTWLLSLLYSVPLLSDQPLPLPVNVLAMMHFALLWTLCLWGGKQQAGFAGRYLPWEGLPPNAAPVKRACHTEPAKYQKSVLTHEELKRIAVKVEAAMQKRQLYLDATLSLHKLAADLQVNSNYLSQTLNEPLQRSFFAFFD